MVALTPVDIGQLIVSTPGVLGGSPRVAGTRISVKHIAECFNDGLPVDEIVGQFPTVDLKGVYAAITYYMANKAAVDEDIADEAREIAQFQRDYPSGHGPGMKPLR